MPSTDIVFCERCNESIPQTAFVDGSAVYRNGRGTCPSCLSQIRDNSFSEQVHFCDLCDESISVGSIREGAAVFLEGRLFCNRCATAVRPGGPVSGLADSGTMSSEGVPGAAPSGVVPGAAASGDEQRVEGSGMARATSPSLASREARDRIGPALAALAFLIVALGASAAFFFFPERLGLGPRSSGVDDAGALSAASSVRDGAVAFEAEGEPVAHDSEGEGSPSPEPGSAGATPDSLITETEAADSGLGAGPLGWEDRLATLEARIAALEASVIDRGEAFNTELDERFGGLETVVSELREDSIAVFEDLRLELSATRGVLEGIAGPAGAVEESGGAEARSGASDSGVTEVIPEKMDPAAEPDPLAEAREALRSPDAGARFSALVELGQKGGREEIPVIAEVLASDEDFVVREFAANILGNLGDREAVVFLIRALRDPAASVVLAADDALRRITRKSFGLKRTSSAAARAEVARKWETWWEKENEGSR